MRTALAVSVPAVSDPVTVAQVKQHSRIDHDGDDELLATYLSAATAMAEGYLSQALLTQTLVWTLTPGAVRWNGRTWLDRRIELPRAPVQSIVSVVMLDIRGNATAIVAAALPASRTTPLIGWIADLSAEPLTLRIGRKTVLSGGQPLCATPLESLTVTFVAGYDQPNDVPPEIRTALMMVTTHLYEHRGDDSGGGMPMAAQWLLERRRLQFMGA